MPELIDLRAVKDRADFETVLSHYDIVLKGSGHQRQALCPFHDDSKPSLSVNLVDKVFNCHSGGCKAKGGIIDFVVAMEKTNVPTAAKFLAHCCGFELPMRDVASSQGHRKATERPQARPEGGDSSDRAKTHQRGSSDL